MTDKPEHASIAAAIIGVMEDVRGVGKGTTVGTGQNAYQGVSDKDVKETIRKAMAKHGLAIVPKSVEATPHIERWMEDTKYGPKQKQSVFVEAKTVYTLLHTSGQSLDIEGYGHGVDTQDKAAGKATTYALKYALLYTFLVPTGDIDDADVTHSDDHDVPQKPSKPRQAKQPAKQAPEQPAEPQQGPPTADDVEAAVDYLTSCETLPMLKQAWGTFGKSLKAVPTVIAAKDARKKQLEAAPAKKDGLEELLGDSLPY